MAFSDLEKEVEVVLDYVELWLAQQNQTPVVFSKPLNITTVYV